jgi:bacterioferritin-associated ferredoxin
MEMENNMTPEQVKLVQQSFANVAPISEQAAVLFYDRLFDICCHAIATGARSAVEIAAKLKAGTNCGSCIPEMKRLIAQPHKIPCRSNWWLWRIRAGLSTSLRGALATKQSIFLCAERRVASLRSQ